MNPEYEKLLAETIVQLKTPVQPLSLNHILFINDRGEMTIHLRGYQFIGNLTDDKDVKNALAFIGLHKWDLAIECESMQATHSVVNVVDTRTVVLDAIENILNNYLFKKSSIQ